MTNRDNERPKALSEQQQAVCSNRGIRLISQPSICLLVTPGVKTLIDTLIYYSTLHVSLKSTACVCWKTHNYTVTEETRTG